MAIWNGLTDTGAIVPIQVDDQGRVVVSGGGGIPSQIYGTAKAQGSFTGDGSSTWTINLSATRTAGGVYSCTFDTAQPDTDYSVFVGVDHSGIRIPAVTEKYTTYFVVKLFGLDVGTYDAPFDIAVFNNKPSDVTPLILPVSALNDIERLKAAVGLDDDSPIS